jgi:chitin synthase
MFIYLLSLPIWNLILPAYAYWHFDDFSWGDTRITLGEKRGAGKSGHSGDGEFDSSKITMKRWHDFEQERRLRAPAWASQQGKGGDFYGSGYGPGSGTGSGPYSQGTPTALGNEGRTYRKHERVPSNLVYEERYSDYP